MLTLDKTAILDFESPWLNAAGMLGFALDERALKGVKLGAFITNPVSKRPHLPAAARTIKSFPEGLLLHSGLPNPGLNSVIKSHQNRWATSLVPVIAHIFADTPTDLQKMVEKLETLGCLYALEVGLLEGLNAAEITDWVSSAVGELPVIARLSLSEVVALGPTAIEAGATAISFGPPRGIIDDSDDEIIKGRLYGPALFPQVVSTVKNLALLGVPTIAAGGVMNPAQGEQLLKLGALAVQLDTVLWRGGFAA